ncbi:MAG: choice-of-anchor L domain-containing protein [Chitinophagaceae bacterium]|nr:choice-of-anchor L domain-containing protein [Chitinophagaceae bacterium]
MLFCCFIAVQNTLKAQLQIVPETTALALVQKLLGQGVTVTNVSMVADLRATGFFNNRSGTAIGIDSGIVLSTGRVKTTGTFWGFDGDGTTEAQNAEASSGFALPGDLDLANSISVPLNQTFDACVLEFDFVPLAIPSNSIMFSAPKNIRLLSYVISMMPSLSSFRAPEFPA